MADNDIFRKHVTKAFRSASCSVVRHGNVEQAVRAAVQAVDSVLLGWTPSAIQTALRIHALAVEPCPSLQEQNSRIDRIDALEVPTMTPLVIAAAEIAQRAIRSGKSVTPDPVEFLRLSAASLVRTEVFPATMIAGAVREYGRNRSEIVADEARFEQMLASDSELRVKVMQAVSCSKSSSPVAYRRPKLSQETLLHTPLLEIAS